MTSSPFIGFSSLADDDFAGDHVQPSSVARAFLSPFCLLKSFLQLLQNVRSHLSVRDGFCLPAPIPAHLRHPLSTAPVIAAGRASVIFNRNVNIQ